MRILLATDGSKCSNVAVNPLAKRPGPAGTVVRVLSVIEPVTLPIPEAVTMPESWYEAMRRAVLKTQALTRRFGKLIAADGMGIDIIIRPSGSVRL